MEGWNSCGSNWTAMYLDMVVIPSLSCSGANSVRLEVLMTLCMQLVNCQAKMSQNPLQKMATL
jgi:hypothetical protein